LKLHSEEKDGTRTGSLGIGNEVLHLESCSDGNLTEQGFENINIIVEESEPLEAVTR
jgi:hypothetical protein